MNTQASNLSIQSIAIIGRGKVGQSLTQLFKSIGLSVENIGRDSARQIQSIKQADLSIICVNDGAIKTVCEQLSNHFKHNSIVIHCSGALDSNELNSAKLNDCLIASCHPLNTFPNLESSIARFSNTSHGSYMYAEGQANALSQLLPLFVTAGFKTTTIERSAKPLYHAACVFACNYLTALMDISLETAENAGLERDDFWNSVQPLIQSTLNNISSNGIENALSGPIARGDANTIAKHQESLAIYDPSLSMHYASLGIRAIEIAQRKGELNEKDINALRKILEADT